eukprot:c23105_g4_i2 orf=90-383(-)
MPLYAPHAWCTPQSAHSRKGSLSKNSLAFASKPHFAYMSTRALPTASSLCSKPLLAIFCVYFFTLLCGSNTATSLQGTNKRGSIGRKPLKLHAFIAV